MFAISGWERLIFKYHVFKNIIEMWNILMKMISVKLNLISLLVCVNVGCTC